MTATAIVRRALVGTGIELVASCGSDAYDARAPEALRSRMWLPNPRGLVVAGSAGPTLWRRFRAWIRERGELWDAPDPYDTFIAELLGAADTALHEAGVTFHRFDAAFRAPVRVDFVALAGLVGLGRPGPFALAIHAQHGPWWALRGAWIVDADVDPPLADRSPCVGCAAPCVGGWQNAGTIGLATAEVRGRCIAGPASRYDDEQIAYHYDPSPTVARLRRT
jgi:hypothetical protein